VGQILRQSMVPVLEFRASIVIGHGSVSFEMIRALVERLPIMVTPKWVKVPAQPIAVDDVLDYLVGALDLEVSAYRVYEIGGADQMSYADVMRAYARMRGTRLMMIPVPVLTPFISSLWLGLITPLYARIGRTFCRQCGKEVVRETAEVVARELSSLPTGTRLVIGFDLPIVEAAPLASGETAEAVDEVQEAGAAMNAALVVLGDALGLYKAMRDHGPGAGACTPARARRPRSHGANVFARVAATGLAAYRPPVGNIGAKGNL